jgi:anaerobic selenocysteine-containing dehydrogenase
MTNDRSIHLAPEEFVSGLRELNEKPLVDESDSADTVFDLQLIGRRDPRTNNSWLHNSHRMVKGRNRCLALINPHDALSRELQDGDMAVVRSRVGSIRIPVALSDDMMPGVVSIPHGWGHQMQGVKLSIASQHAGVNTNILTDDCDLDTLSGNAVLNGIPVSITKDPVPLAN